ncbi:MAG: peroxide stress protein YaaA [Bacteroidales bacterium]|nr:peroxide stress protein YaaA [Bacteroidales bacterium]MCF8405031.1 peroxide stress protein YaaA [Bacteroidales bacterium]
MLILISPAKTLDLSAKELIAEPGIPVFLDKADTLVQVLKKYSANRLSKLMKVSPQIANLNFERFQEWTIPFTLQNAKQTLLTFKGEVYNGIQAETLNKEDWMYTDQHLLILSGLYGLLKPSDLILPYRLEMSTALKFRKYKNLYDFWEDRIANQVLEYLEPHDQRVIINLSSKEYFKAVDRYLKEVRVITPEFKEARGETYKFVHTLGKKARGLMTRFIIDHKISDPEHIKAFDSEGYVFNPNLSKGHNWVFTRG